MEGNFLSQQIPLVNGRPSDRPASVRRHSVGWRESLLMPQHEAEGGLLFGLALGYLTVRPLKSVDSYKVGLVERGSESMRQRYPCSPPSGVEFRVVPEQASRPDVMCASLRQFFDSE